MAKNKKNTKFSTKSIHTGNRIDETGATVTPLHLTSTFRQPSFSSSEKFVYSRTGGPTIDALEENFAMLEDAKFSFAFASGMAAMSAIFLMFKPGDHVLISQNVYGGVFRLVTKVLNDNGVNFDFIDTTDLKIIEQAIRPTTKLIHLETPSNPLLEIADISSISKVCKSKNILVSVDNTFMSPYGQRPLDLGANITMQSSTKSLSGHSDILGGVLATNKEDLYEKLQFMLKATGGVPSPFDNWLTLRSTKTLALRYQRAADNAFDLAKWLSMHKKVSKTIYPGLDSHPQHEIACKQQLSPKGENVFGSMLSIDLGDVEFRDRFLKNIEIFQLAESLGSVESLVCIPYFMTHAAVPVETKLEMGITESLVRLSIGIEDIEDLINDLAIALEK